jgi:hypothetical protein
MILSRFKKHIIYIRTEIYAKSLSGVSEKISILDILLSDI